MANDTGLHEYFIRRAANPPTTTPRREFEADVKNITSIAPKQCHRRPAFYVFHSAAASTDDSSPAAGSTRTSHGGRTCRLLKPSARVTARLVDPSLQKYLDSFWGVSPSDNPQMSLVYEAEWGVHEGRTFKSLRAAKTWLNTICRSRWFQAKFLPFYKFHLHDGPEAVGASARRNGFECHIVLPKNMRTELTILHELAHCVGHLSHNHDFCHAYLKLVKQFLGRESWDNLRYWFNDLNVKYWATRLPRLYGVRGPFSVEEWGSRRLEPFDLKGPLSLELLVAQSRRHTNNG